MFLLGVMLQSERRSPAKRAGSTKAIRAVQRNFQSKCDYRGRRLFKAVKIHSGGRYFRTAGDRFRISVISDNGKGKCTDGTFHSCVGV